MTTSRNTRAAGALVALALPFVLLASIGLALDSTAQASSAGGTGCTGLYGWPVKPFDRAHPIRGTFGDPRTVFSGTRSERTLLEGNGGFSFHQGLDISAPDGSPVYAVSSGTVVRARGGRVTVECGNGRSFQYWHIEPVARVGQRAVPGKTLLGFIQPKREHVHLTHLERGRAVNPLAPGRVTPYRDATSPEVLDVAIIHGEVGRDLAPRVVAGRVTLVAEAIDTPALPVPGRWHGFPVTPALLSWRIETSDGQIVRQHITRDVRRVVPKNDLFWRTFARGAHQNWPVFAGRKQQFVTARYLFKLSARPFDTTTLRDGDYVLVVSAADTAGNRNVRRLSFSIDNGLSGS
jgi:hypothetical protein